MTDIKDKDLGKKIAGAIAEFEDAVSKWEVAKQQATEASREETRLGNLMRERRKSLEALMDQYGKSLPREAEWKLTGK